MKGGERGKGSGSDEAREGEEQVKGCRGGREWEGKTNRMGKRRGR